jgi:hypothetical protein
MKRQLTTLMALVIVLASCTKSTIRETENNAVSEERIQRLLSTSDFQTRIQLFDVFTSRERYELWHRHLLKARAQYLQEENPARVSKIDELLAAVSVEVFVPNSREADIFSNYFMPKWNESAKKLFDQVELYNMVFDPVSDQMNVMAPDDIGTGGMANCFCHVGSSGFSCRKIEVRYPAGFTITNGICERTNDCKGSSTGCGWLWLQSCYGSHCNF